jgi:hypothetical protein
LREDPSNGSTRGHVVESHIRASSRLLFVFAFVLLFFGLAQGQLAL